MEYILIIVMVHYHGVAVTTQEFSNAASCWKAAHSVKTNLIKTKYKQTEALVTCEAKNIIKPTDR